MIIKAYFASLCTCGSAEEPEAVQLGLWKPGQPFYQLQKNDELGVLESDEAAIEAAITDAENGDQYAIEQLSLAATDPLVFKIRQQRAARPVVQELATSSSSLAGLLQQAPSDDLHTAARFIGFEATVGIVENMLYALLPEEVVVVAMDILKEEHERLAKGA